MKPVNNRILFTGDCNYLFAHDYRNPEDQHGPYTVHPLEEHIDLLADSGVDTHLINPNGQRPWYPSKVVASMIEGYTRGDWDYIRPHYPPLAEDFTQEQLDKMLDFSAAMLDRYLDLVEAGVDWVAHMAAHCRKRGISPWATIRMNDGHGANSWDKSYFNCPEQADPKMRLSGTRLDPRRGVASGMTVCNYEHKEVRDYYFAIIRELVEDYDFDGIELDWLRMPLCCEPPATAETVRIITDWHAQIRDLTRKRAEKTGKPFFLGLRIPCRLDALRTVGLDVAAMAQEGVLDFISMSNFWQTSWDVPYDRVRERVGDEVALYGVIEDAPNWMFAAVGQGGTEGYRLLSASAELIRGNAAGKLAMGADGIELFNFFCTSAIAKRKGGPPNAADYSAMRGVDDLESLRDRPKHYALATQTNYWSPRFFEFADQLPAFVEPASRVTFRLSMCTEPVDSRLELWAQIITESPDGDPTEQLGIGINGSLPVFEGEATDQLLLPTGIHTHQASRHKARNYRLNKADVREGWNDIVVYHSEDACDPRPGMAGDAIRIVSVELAVIDPATK